MRIAFSTLGCPDWSFSEILSTAKDFGYNGIEIRGLKNEIFAPAAREFKEDRIENTKQSLKELDLEISCFSSASYLFDKNNTEEAIKEGCSYIDLANKMDVKFVRVLGDKDPHPSKDIDDDFVRENLQYLVDYGNEKGVIPLIETNGVFADTKRLVKLVDKIEGNVGILWDIHHPCRFFRENPQDTFDRIKPYLRYVHFKDSVFESGQVRYKMPGYGDLPVRQAINILLDNDFEGYVSLEWVKRWYYDLEEPGVVFMHFAHYIRKLERKKGKSI
ncbi:MAG: sugar phosphate isomerase/epimerase [Clostridiaceae bacterium]|nr:sugar phosphate isomerase/epimerase [Clostridiaceae bacterium]